MAHTETTTIYTLATVEEVCEELGLTPAEFAAMDGATKFDAVFAYRHGDAVLTFEVDEGENYAD